MKGKPWTKEQLGLLEKHYPNMRTDVLAEMIGRPVKSLYNQAKVKGISKTPEFLASPEAGRLTKGTTVGKNTYFKKGMNPWNAGRTGIRVSPKSEFKKGNLPGNTLYNGAITIRTDTCQKTAVKRKYKYIRLSKAVWDLYQRYVWRQHHGSIPRGHVIRFIDGDTMNCHISNLECISGAENARRNHNPSKAAHAHRINWEEGYDNGTKSLSDRYVAGLIAEGDHRLRDFIIEKHQDLIEVKRQQLLLNRKIKYHEKQNV